MVALISIETHIYLFYLNAFGHFNSLLLKYYLGYNKMIIYKYTFYLELICYKFKILAKYFFYETLIKIRMHIDIIKISIVNISFVLQEQRELSLKYGQSLIRDCFYNTKLQVYLIISKLLLIISNILHCSI